MKQKRLSLEDFKLKKSESQNEIDKLIGGDVAAACHEIPTKGLAHMTDGTVREITDVYVPNQQ
jgi:hypothetical protein